MTPIQRFAAAMAIAGLGIAVVPAPARADFAEDYADALYAGQLAQAADLAAQAGDGGQARFALGAAQFLLAIETLGHGLYRYGLAPEYRDTIIGMGVSDLPFLRLPIPENPNPEPVTYAGLRAVLEGFTADLATARDTLDQVGPEPFDLTLDAARIGLDFDRNGSVGEEESLTHALLAVSRTTVPQDGLVIDFDQSDAPWLSGYCHLLTAMADFLLAHDWETSLELTFHNLFPASDLPSSELAREQERDWVRLEHFLGGRQQPPAYPQKPGNMSWEEFSATPEYRAWQDYADLQETIWMGNVADLIAFAHLFHWPVVAPDRMAAVRTELLAMIATSRENWSRIMAETDNKHEWVPSPGQTGVFANMRVTDEIVEAWMYFLDQFDSVLNGDRLIAHWRFAGRGINLRRMFEDPRTFDPVLIAQGSAVLPYLENGDIAGSETAGTLFRLFGGGFLAYFLWFN